MKPVFKCEYCRFMGTEDEVSEHQVICVDNYDKRSCHTCRHKRTKFVGNNIQYECDNKIDIPEGRLFEHCPSYERKEKTSDLAGLFTGIFDR